MTRHLLNYTAAIALFASPLSAHADCMGPYPPSMVKAFNDSCTTSPKMQPFCACIMEDVQKNIPLAEFIEIGNTGGGIDKDPRFLKASQKCNPLLTGQAPVATVPNTTLAPTGIVPAGTPTATPSTTAVVKSPGVIFK